MSPIRGGKTHLSARIGGCGLIVELPVPSFYRCRVEGSDSSADLPKECRRDRPKRGSRSQTQPFGGNGEAGHAIDVFHQRLHARRFSWSQIVRCRRLPLDQRIAEGSELTASTSGIVPNDTRHWRRSVGPASAPPTPADIDGYPGRDASAHQRDECGSGGADLRRRDALGRGPRQGRAG